METTLNETARKSFLNALHNYNSAKKSLETEKAIYFEMSKFQDGEDVEYYRSRNIRRVNTGGLDEFRIEEPPENPEAIPVDWEHGTVTHVGLHEETGEFLYAVNYSNHFISESMIRKIPDDKKKKKVAKSENRVTPRFVAFGNVGTITVTEPEGFIGGL